MIKYKDEEIIEEKPLLEVVEKNMIDYGSHVIENRAIPDYRDGLKPVARRILWAAHGMKFFPNGPYYKSARLVGETIGKFSPHGELSCYSALVHMVNLPIPLMGKQGNFGCVNDSGFASSRYTEVRLSNYGYKGFFNPHLEEVVDMMPNYDNREIEPLYLPAMYPNLLLNGTSGIGVGVTCDIPPLHLDSLMHFIEQAFKGEELSAEKMAKNLKFNWKYGSHCVSSTEEIINWIKNGSQSLWFEPSFELNPYKRLINITEVSPNFNFDKIVYRLLADKKGKKKYDFISSVDDECTMNKKTNKESISFVVKLKNTIDPDKFSELAHLVVNEFTNYVKTATNVTIRKKSGIKFLASNMPDLITRWSQYRIDIEKKILTVIIAKLEKEIEYKNLMLLAIANRKEIAKAWEVTKPYNYVQEKLNITKEQAHIIMNWSLISLANMSKDKVLYDKKELQQQTANNKKILKDPNSKILTDMSENRKILNP